MKVAPESLGVLCFEQWRVMMRRRFSVLRCGGSGCMVDGDVGDEKEGGDWML